MADPDMSTGVPEGYRPVRFYWLEAPRIMEAYEPMKQGQHDVPYMGWLVGDYRERDGEWHAELRLKFPSEDLAKAWMSAAHEAAVRVGGCAFNSRPV